MGLNTAASISFSQINSTSYFTNGNLGINTTNPTANLDVVGTINASGLSSLASITTGALSATNVSAGIINSSGLTTGNINFTGSLFQNGVAYVGSQWTSTAGNVSYTSGSVVATNAEFTNATINNFSFGTNVTVNNLLASSLNLGISSMYSGSFVASNNVAIATDVIGLAFANANIRSFNASISISLILSAESSLYGMVNLNGTQNANGWSLYTETMGDATGVTFTITSSGQIQYTSTNQTNWSSTTFRFNVQQFSATGTYSSLSANTQGSYIMDSIQLNSLTDAVPGVSNGPLYILGGATIEKRLNVNGVVSTGGLSVTNATATNISTGTINATGTSVLANVTATNVSAGTINATGLSALANATVTNVSVGTINATGLSTFTNAVYTNVSTGTLIATTSVTSGLLSATNVVGTSISAGTLSSTTITGANLSLSGNLSVAGTLTTVNITSTNILNTNISAGTINATGLSSLTNATATNISTGGLNATGTSILAHTYVTGPGAGVGTNGSLLVSGNDAYGHALYVASASAIGKRIGFQQTGTVGSIFAYNYTGNAPQNLALQIPGGNVGIGTESPTAKLHVAGNVILNPQSTDDHVGISWLRSSNNTDWFMYNPAGTDQLRIYNGSDRITFTPSGNVGIGTASPAYALDVNGTARASSLYAGNNPFKVFIVTGTHAASQGGITDVSLPSGCNLTSITMIYGVTINSNDDVIPFSGYAVASWGVEYLISNDGTRIRVIAGGSVTPSKTFKITIVTL